MPVVVSVVVFAALAVGWAFNPFTSSARFGAPQAAPPGAQAGTEQQAQALSQPADQSRANQAAADATNQASAQGLPALQRGWAAATPGDGIVPDPVLTSRLDQALVGVDGQVGVVVKDLGSGRGAVLNGNTELQSASLFKLPVLFTVFESGLNMSEELTISDEALSYDAGTMELTAGETLSVAEALERMVTLSDNTSAILLGSRVGANRINANIAALGMETTHYSLERMTTSALDMAHLMELVADGKAVSPSASADMLHLMLRQRVNDRLPRLLPDDIQVAHKTGNLPGVVNDLGILYGPRSTVVVAALVSDTSDEVAAANGIAQVGQVASTYFENHPEVVADRPTVLPAPLRAIPPVFRESHPIPTALPSLAPRAVSVAVPSPTAAPGAGPGATAEGFGPDVARTPGVDGTAGGAATAVGMPGAGAQSGPAAQNGPATVTPTRPSADLTAAAQVAGATPTRPTAPAQATVVAPANQAPAATAAPQAPTPAPQPPSATRGPQPPPTATPMPPPATKATPPPATKPPAAATPAPTVATPGRH